MTERQRPARVGIRELRQNLSVYLRRVKEGETLEVTEHGDGVAYFIPIGQGQGSRRDQLIAEGRLIPATEDLLAFDPLEPAPGASATEILLETRSDER